MKTKSFLSICVVIAALSAQASYAQDYSGIRLGEPSTPIIAVPSGFAEIASAVLSAGGCPVSVDTKCIKDFNVLRDLSASLDGFVITPEFAQEPDQDFLQALADRNVPVMGSCEALEQINKTCKRMPDGIASVEGLIARASAYKHSKQLMARILSLDSHCDQPCRWSRGADVGVRNATQVSIPKLWEGCGDAAFFVAYLHQEAIDKESQAVAAAKCEGIIDGIIAQVAKYPDYCGIARNASELRELKNLGKKAIFIGVENAYGIGDDLSLIAKYASKGVTYMTLSHTGDNAVCASSTPSKDGSPKHGLTAYGRKVVGELNRCGILIDLSHTSDSTFWQSLELSKAPVVCSHSGSRALCDNDRNISDEMLKALSAAGGVIQVDAYRGFLRKDSANATIDDFMRHLQHCIDVAGIDHVGVGLDFDGGAGIPGLNGANDYINVTVRLVEAGFNDEDIAKVWGGNFLRAIDEAGRVARKLQKRMSASGLGKSNGPDPSAPITPIERALHWK